LPQEAVEVTIVGRESVTRGRFATQGVVGKGLTSERCGGRGASEGKQIQRMDICGAGSDVGMKVNNKSTVVVDVESDGQQSKAQVEEEEEDSDGEEETEEGRRERRRRAADLAFESTYNPVEFSRLYPFIRRSYFHDAQLEVVRSEMTYSDMRDAIRRLEEAAEVDVSVSSSGELAVHVFGPTENHPDPVRRPMADVLLPVKGPAAESRGSSGDGILCTASHPHRRQPAKIRCKLHRKFIYANIKQTMNASS